MKKILFLLALSISLAFTAMAQKNLETTLVSQYSNTVDTVDNAETIYLNLSTAAAQSSKAFYKTALVVFKTQEISGTGGGTATLEVSSNGTDFATHPSASAYTIVDQTAAQTTAWKIDNFAGKTFRIKITGTGTMSYKVWASAILKN